MGVCLVAALFYLSAPVVHAGESEPKSRGPVARELLAQIKSEHRYDPSVAQQEPPVSDEMLPIIFLPKITVTQRRSQTPGADEVSSNEGRMVHLRKRYRGASFRGQAIDSRLPNYAALMWREDERLADQQEIGELVDVLEQVGDSAGAKDLKTTLPDAFIRRSDPKTSAMETSVTNGRR